MSIGASCKTLTHGFWWSFETGTRYLLLWPPSYFVTKNDAITASRPAHFGREDDYQVSRQRAIHRVDLDFPGVYSHLFFAQKKMERGGWSSIWNLWTPSWSSLYGNVNSSVSQEPTSDLGLAAFIDLKDTNYLNMLFYRMFLKYLCFLFDNSAYTFYVVPFGLVMSPHVLTGVVKTVMAQLHLSGVQMHTYLDDSLIPSLSLQAYQTNVHLVLDIILQLVKSKLAPAQICTFQGVVFNVVEANVCPIDAHILRFVTPVAFVPCLGLLWLAHSSVPGVMIWSRRVCRTSVCIRWSHYTSQFTTSFFTQMHHWMVTGCIC